MCRWSATHHWKALKGYNFAINLIAIGGLYKKLCALKVAGILTIGIFRDKKPFGCGPHGELQSIYYMGEGGGFPRVQAVVNLVSPESPVACPSTKDVPEVKLTNLWLVECIFE